MTVRILVGDVRERLRELPDASAQCVVTSPPYYGLRDYGTASWDGGRPDCPHRVGGQVQDNKAPGAIVAGVRPGVDASRCLDCGARRVDLQIGLERSPDEYVETMVAVFREVRRVLALRGTLWLNLGDSYANDAKWGGSTGGRHPAGLHGATGIGRTRKSTGLKPKDLIGIPWRVAFALQDDGWWLRSDIVWSKPTVMPESVDDRPTKAHDYVFLLTRAPRYFYDAGAIREADAGTDHARRVLTGQASLEPSGGLASPHMGIRTATGRNGEGRNARSVWTINPEPFAGAHFATMPTRLAERCIRAGSQEGDAVLDPFGGAGTTGLVAQRLGRDCTLIELNPEYAAMAERRIAADAPLFASRGPGPVAPPG